MRLARFERLESGAPVIVALEYVIHVQPIDEKEGSCAIFMVDGSVLDVGAPAWAWFNAFVERDRS